MANEDLKKKLRTIAQARLSPDLAGVLMQSAHDAELDIPAHVDDIDLPSADDYLATARGGFERLRDGSAELGNMQGGLQCVANYLVYMLSRNKNHVHQALNDGGSACDRYMRYVGKEALGLLFNHEYLPLENGGLPDLSYQQSAAILVAHRTLMTLGMLTQSYPRNGTIMIAGGATPPPEAGSFDDQAMTLFKEAPQVLSWIQHDVLEYARNVYEAGMADMPNGKAKRKLQAECRFITGLSDVLSVTIRQYSRAIRDLADERAHE